MTITESTQTQIVAVAQAMLAKEVGIVEGCRRLVKLSSCLDASADELFAPIVAVESETDSFPVGKARSLWSAKALSRKDAEVSIYLSQVREIVLEACEALVKRYAN